MKITLKPGEMLTNIKGTQSKPIILEFKSDWNFGHVIMVNNLIHCTGFITGDRKGFPADSSVSIANGGNTDIEIEIVTVW